MITEGIIHAILFIVSIVMAPIMFLLLPVQEFILSGIEVYKAVMMAMLSAGSYFFPVAFLKTVLIAIPTFFVISLSIRIILFLVRLISPA